MASAKDGWVRESPKVLGVGATATYAIDFVDVGTPTGTPDVKAYDATGTDKSSDVLTGTPTILGTVVTLKKFTPASEQVYRIVCAATIGNDTVFGIVEVAVYAKTHAVATVASGAYGTLDGVASLVPRGANKGGVFDDTTTPTAAQVAGFIAQVSAIINVMFRQHGFSTPVSDPDVTPALILFVNQEVAAIVEGVRGSGRFGPTIEGRRASGRKSRFQIIMDDVAGFIAENLIGLESLGATRNRNLTSGMGFRSTDEAGDATDPLFQRKAFGETSRNWDA